MTTPIVVCFSGRIGSGKTSVSQCVATTLGAAWTSFGGFIRDAAQERGLDANSREVLQTLGAQLISEKGTDWLCEQVITRAKWDGHQPLVIDGVRHIAVLDTIYRRLSPHRTILIHLDYDGMEDGERGMNATSRRAAELHSTEHDVLQELPSRADLVVSTSLPLEDVVSKVLGYVKPLVY